MICITCGKNEAINDFYKECQECIENFQREKEMEEEMENEITPEKIGVLVQIHLEAKKTNTKLFFCIKCKHYLSFKEMDSVRCYCCGNGICKVCAK